MKMRKSMAMGLAAVMAASMIPAVPAMADDIRFILSNRYLAECNIRFLSEFYVGAIVTYVSDKLCDPICTDILADIKPFQNIVHSSLESEIKKQQLKRVL